MSAVIFAAMNRMPLSRISHMAVSRSVFGFNMFNIHLLVIGFDLISYLLRIVLYQIKIVKK